jgi:hypothetical protein
MSETGTTTLGISVDRTLRRNRNTTRITREMEIIMAIWTSRTEARMVEVASTTVFRSMVGGREAVSVQAI